VADYAMQTATATTNDRASQETLGQVSKEVIQYRTLISVNHELVEVLVRPVAIALLLAKEPR
jgi:hypothetical protein